MDSREFIRSIQNGKGSGSPWYEYLSASTAGELAGQISGFLLEQQPDFFEYAVEATRLQEVATRFHTQAGTLTDAVKRSIYGLSEGFARVRIAHQPNTFMADRVAIAFEHLDLTGIVLEKSHNTPISPVYLAVDYDDAGDDRFRVAHTTSLSSGNDIVLSVVPKSSFSRAMFAVEKPEWKIFDNWIHKIRQGYNPKIAALETITKKGDFNAYYRRVRNAYGGHPGILSRNPDEFEHDVQEAYQRAETLVEFNLIFLSREWNLGYPVGVVFLPGHKIQPSLSKAYEFLLTKLLNIRSAESRAVMQLQEKGIRVKYRPIPENVLPVWYLCDGVVDGKSCARRVRIFMEPGELLLVHGTCPHVGCSSHGQYPAGYHFALGTRIHPSLEAIKSRMAPYVLMDDLLDRVGFGFVGGVNYIGSSDHMLVAQKVEQELFAGLPVPQAFLDYQTWTR